MNLTAVHHYRRKIALELKFETHRFREGGPQHDVELANERIQIEQRKMGFGLPRRSEQLLHEPCAALDRLLNDLNGARNDLGAGAPFLQLARIAEDDRENVVEIVSNASGQCAQALHLLRLNELLFETFALGVVKQITLHTVDFVFSVKATNEPRDHVNRFAAGLPHLQLISIDRFALPQE